MTLPVLIQRNGKNEFLATVVGLPDCHASATSREEAIAAVRTHIVDLQQGSDLAFVEVELPDAAGGSPRELFGAYRGDSTWGEVFDGIEKERQALDERNHQDD